MKKVPAFDEFVKTKSFGSLMPQFKEEVIKHFTALINSPAAKATRRVDKNEKITLEDIGRNFKVGKDESTGNSTFTFQVGQIREFICLDYAENLTEDVLFDEIRKLAEEFAAKHRLLVEVEDNYDSKDFGSAQGEDWRTATVQFFKQDQRGSVAGKKLGII